MTSTPHRAALTAAILAISASAARAQPADDAAGEPREQPDTLAAHETFAPSVWSSLGALVPGFVVPGLGHRIAGDRRTARKLLRQQGATFGVMAVSGGVLALSGASRWLSRPMIPILLASSSVFLAGWGADVFGASGGPRLAGVASTRTPNLDVRLGYLYVHDPRFRYASFADLGADLRARAWWVSARAYIATPIPAPADNQRVRLALGYRAIGPRPDRHARDGSFLDVLAAATHHRYGDEGFTTTAVEVTARGRHDLARFSSTTRGSFAEVSLGLGFDVTSYAAALDRDVTDLLVGGFAYGIYLGRPGGIRGEAKVFYEHRRDGLAGGIALPRGNSGFAGSFGGDATVHLTDRWGAALHLEVGSAYLAGAGLLYRQ